MKSPVLALVIPLLVDASGCIGTMDALVQVQGNIEPGRPDQSQCQLFLVAASEREASLSYGRDVRGQFVEQFIVHPWQGKYLATVKCGETVRLSKEIEYREFGTHPYDLGSIAP